MCIFVLFIFVPCSNICLKSHGQLRDDHLVVCLHNQVQDQWGGGETGIDGDSITIDTVCGDSVVTVFEERL